MTAELRELLIRDLERARVGFGQVAESAVVMRSPTCGDQVAVEVAFDSDDMGTPIIRSVTWRGHGCTVSMGSASALATIAPGMTPAEFCDARNAFSTLVRGAEPSADLEREFETLPALGDAVAFAGIGRLPLRATCATLAWNAVDGAIAARCASGGQRAS